MLIFIFRMVCAMIAGVIVALITKSRASIMAFAIVTMGATLVCYISMEYLRNYSVYAVSDPGRLGAQVVAVVGLIAAGLIVFNEGKDNKSKKVRELTPAAGLWLSAIIGITIGVDMMKTAIFTLVAVFVIYRVADFLKQKKNRTDN